jgi:hypothetical protein
MEKVDSWHHGVSPPSHQTQLDSLLAALKALADDGLTAGASSRTSITGGSFP